MNTSIPTIVWLSCLFVATTCISAIVLSIQRGLYHKGIQLKECYIKRDYKRDINIPYNDKNRLTRIIYGTLLLCLSSALQLYYHIHDTNKVWYVTCSISIFVAWLYALVLALISQYYALPDSWGWKLNVHLFVLYSTGWITFISQFQHVEFTIWLFQIVIGFDLVYVTATTKQGPPFLDENGQQVCQINVESILGICFFNWCTPIVHIITSKKSKIVIQDLPVLTPSYRASNIFIRVGISRDLNLFKRIFNLNRGSIMIQIGLSLIASALHYLPAFFMNRLLQFLQDYNNGILDFDNHIRYGLMLVIGMGLSTVFMGITSGHQWFHATCVLHSKIRTMLTVEIYRKSLRCRCTTKNDASGTMVNLIGSDASRVADFSSYWFSMISAPLELTLGIYFLYQMIGISCIYGLLFMVLILPLNHFNSRLYSKTQDRLMTARDKRISLMNEMLQGIRQIKYFAWEKNWEQRIMEARNVELYQLAMTFINSIFFSLVWQGAPIIVTLISFFSFTKIQGNELTAPIAFTVINVFAELRYALNIIPETCIQGIAAFSSIKRIQKFLQESEIEPASPQNPLQNAIIGFDHATISWGKNTDDFHLKHLHVQFPRGEFSLISGATGSGKTLMLLGLLGESILLEGKIHCPRVPMTDNILDFQPTSTINSKDWILEHSLAYVSQTPWLQNASIRDNILFGLPLIETRYKQTLYACALDKDLSIFEDGDRTEIGEKGITLSGGQKARVALARAVYSRAQHVLMDDVLSAIDAHTAKHIYEKCLMGPLMLNRTRILVTHHINLCLKGCKLLIHIKNGGIDHMGSPTELCQSGKLNYIMEQEECIEQETNEDENTINVNNEEARTLVEEESRESGSVKLWLYGAYFKMIGKIVFWVIMMALILFARGLQIGENWWIKNWAQSYDTISSNENKPMSRILISRSLDHINLYQNVADEKLAINHTLSEGTLHINYYLGIYCLIACSNVIFCSLRYGYLYWGTIQANKALYKKLLQRILHAPLRFFDTTPLGRILNRFSKDFDSIDSRIPTEIMDFVTQWLAVLSSAITICLIIPVFIIPLISIAIINVLIGIDYVCSSREIKRLDSITRSPLFSNFTETAAGIITIRAFGVSQQFLHSMMTTLDANICTFFYSWSISRWISIRYAVTSAAINFIACAFTLWYSGKIDVALAGFGLSFVLMFTENMFWGIRQYTGLEMSFNAVERIVEFIELEQEAPAVTEFKSPNGWPTRGEIQVNDLQVKYATDLDLVLKGISFHVKPQEKIGIVGRTGSGKSTLALSFFRFLEATQGSIVIDGVDIKQLGTQDLRSNLTIIPQDPTLFSGTLRSNMDPFNQFDDEAILAAFRRVHLISDTLIDNQETLNVFKNLDTIVSENGKNFSQGQRQLLCLARALLKSSRIVFMDEATASVDFETDKAIQKTISTEFTQCTILCIAHRLHTVIEYDRILVLDQGKVAEFESPLNLISNPESIFYKMCRNSGEYDALLKLSQNKHQLIDL